MKTEIELRYEGGYIDTYWSNAVPRIGEKISLKHELMESDLKVLDVTHRVFQDEETDEILSYVIVNSERV